MHTVKAACAMTDACDKIMEMNLKSDQCREMITPVNDALALLGVVTAKINQFRREQMKDRLPAKMQPLTKNVPPESEWLFGNDLSKRINQLNSANTALIKTKLLSVHTVGKIPDTHLNQHHQGHQHLNQHSKKLAVFPEGLCSREEMDQTAEQQIHQKLNSVSSNKSTSEFVAGNIKNFIENWKEITSDSIILDIVENGLKLTF